MFYSTSWAQRILAVAAMLTFTTSLWAQSTGAVSGRVSNAATGSFLQDAVVTLEPGGASTLTSREGRFNFAQVPPGQYRVRVTRHTELLSFSLNLVEG